MLNTLKSPLSLDILFNILSFLKRSELRQLSRCNQFLQVTLKPLLNKQFTCYQRNVLQLKRELKTLKTNIPSFIQEVTIY
jgi:hypothetical protein